MPKYSECVISEAPHKNNGLSVFGGVVNDALFNVIAQRIVREASCRVSYASIFVFCCIAASCQEDVDHGFTACDLKRISSFNYRLKTGIKLSSGGAATVRIGDSHLEWLPLLRLVRSVGVEGADPSAFSFYQGPFRVLRLFNSGISTFLGRVDGIPDMLF